MQTTLKGLTVFNKWPLKEKQVKQISQPLSVKVMISNLQWFISISIVKWNNPEIKGLKCSENKPCDYRGQVSAKSYHFMWNFPRFYEYVNILFKWERW